MSKKNKHNKNSNTDKIYDINSDKTKENITPKSKGNLKFAKLDLKNIGFTKSIKTDKIINTENDLKFGTSFDPKEKEEEIDISKENMMEFFYDVYTIIFNYLRTMGVVTLKVAKKTSKFLQKFYDVALKKHAIKIKNGFIKIGKLFSKLGHYIIFKIYMFLKFFIDAKNVIKNGFNTNKEKNILIRFGGATKAFFKGVYNNRRIFVTWLNYIFPAVAIAGFCIIVSKATELNFAVGVEYNGEKIGYISDETVFEKAQTKLQERMIYLKDEDTYEIAPKFSLEIVNKNNIKDTLEITDAMIKFSNEDIVKATGLSIDGQFYGAVKEGDKLETILSEKLNSVRAKTKAKEVKFAKTVETEEGMFLSKNIKPITDLTKLIDKEEEKDAYYTIKDGQTPIMIASANDINLDELVALNPHILEKCLIGQQVLINKSQKFLPISTVATETYKQNVGFETETVNSNKLYVGMKTTTREGVSGEKTITAKVQRVDGEEISREIITEDITKAPVNQIITKGTLPVPTYDTPTYNGPKSNAGFIWPVSGGYISQQFQGSRHTGIDYAFRGNGRGQPIIAAAPGKVIQAGKVPSYGNLVKIDHGNGLVTWYAHCLDGSLRVKVGQTVAQGQRISSVGNTGYSFGYHLHFIVSKNGSWQNPRNYLP